MKKPFITLITMHAFFILLFMTSCFKKTDYRTHIGGRQMSLLTTPKPGSTVEFDEGGTRTIATVGNVFIETVLTEDTKGGMYHDGGSSYHREEATIYYSPMLSIYANSADPYRPQIDSMTQGVRIGPSSYAINFDHTLSSKVINGVTYTDVVLGIDPLRNDTLFWKKGLGILGWKRADQSFTAYRVF